MAGNVELSHGQTSLKFGGILGAVTLVVLIIGGGIAAIFYQNVKILEMLHEARVVQATMDKRQRRIVGILEENRRDLLFMLGTLFPRDTPSSRRERHHSE